MTGSPRAARARRPSCWYWISNLRVSAPSNAFARCTREPIWIKAMQRFPVSAVPRTTGRLLGCALWLFGMLAHAATPGSAARVAPASAAALVATATATAPGQQKAPPPCRASQSSIIGSAPAITTADVTSIIAARCAACHSAHASAILRPSKGPVLSSAADVEAHAAAIYRQVVQSRKMPPMWNVTRMTDTERLQIAQWFDARSQPSCAPAGSTAPLQPSADRAPLSPTARQD